MMFTASLFANTLVAAPSAVAVIRLTLAAAGGGGGSGSTTTVPSFGELVASGGVSRRESTAHAVRVSATAPARMSRLDIGGSFRECPTPQQSSGHARLRRQCGE